MLFRCLPTLSLEKYVFIYFILDKILALKLTFSTLLLVINKLTIRN